MLCYAMLCYAMLCYAMLLYVMLRYATLAVLAMLATACCALFYAMPRYAGDAGDASYASSVTLRYAGYASHVMAHHTVLGCAMLHNATLGYATSMLASYTMQCNTMLALYANYAMRLHPLLCCFSSMAITSQTRQSHPAAITTDQTPAAGTSISPTTLPELPYRTHHRLCYGYRICTAFRVTLVRDFCKQSL